MLIGINGNEANVENRVGVNTYAFELLKAIKKLEPEWKDKHKFVIFLKDAPLKELPEESKHWKYKVLPGKGLWIITVLMPYLYKAKNKPDVLFTPSHYVPPFSPMPKICSIMDLGYLESSEQFKTHVFWQLKYWTAMSIKVSKRVIAISEATKKDIVRHYSSASDKIIITHLAYDKDLFNQTKYKNNVRRIKDKYKIPNEYILYLGTLKPSKNVDGVINAFSLLKNKNKSDLKLVVAGKKGWLYENIFSIVKNLNLEDDVIFTGFIPEEDKVTLMTGAKLLATPSYWEGFGLHVLESLAVGTPVVSSDRGSLKEVGGDVVEYVDPDDTKDIARGFNRIISLEQGEYNKLVKDGVKWSKNFTWEKTARKTLNIIESIE